MVLGHNRQGAGAAADTAVTGLALLTFLGAGHTHLDGPYQQPVAEGLVFLMRSQDAEGSLAGSASSYARTYSHSMATFALAEAYALTGDERLKPATRRAVGHLLRAENKTFGGWRYNAGDQGDVSQLGWIIMATSQCGAGRNRHTGRHLAADSKVSPARDAGPQRGTCSLPDAERLEPPHDGRSDVLSASAR